MVDLVYGFLRQKVGKGIVVGWKINVSFALRAFSYCCVHNGSVLDTVVCVERV